MRPGFYLRLAIDGIRKNRRLYLPFILTSAGIAAVFYILMFLQQSNAVFSLRGGLQVAVVLRFGVIVIAIFSCIFLFYTNSFLIRRRKSEFGLYGILGMNRANLSCMLFFETLIVYAVTVVSGAIAGILLSKLSELLLVNILGGITSFDLSVSFGSLAYLAAVFGAVFLLLLLNTMRQIRFSSTISLIKSEKFGEKPPKGNAVFGILGVIILGGAYWLALSIKDPVEAMVWFLIAVIMVIIATYLIMISGSVSLCRLLQKSKKYYYSPKHFVSVSSMVYRMKRNGAGLASICILATMVLVTLSTTTSLYFGMDDALNAKNPRDMFIHILSDKSEDVQGENIRIFKSAVSDAAHDAGIDVENAIGYSSINIRTKRTGSTFTNIDVNSGNDVTLCIIPLSDYNAATGSSETLGDGEALIGTYRMKYDYDTVKLWGDREFRVRPMNKAFFDYNLSDSSYPVITLVIDDFDLFPDPIASGRKNASSYTVARYEYSYYFDTGESPDQQIEKGADLIDGLVNRSDITYSLISYSLRENNRIDYYSTFGGLFYLGIILSAVFSVAAVLIIYYKQISEGYEDHSRFSIMQKIGMTEREIKRSINSQLLTVFYLPLIGAGLHLAFAFPMMRKILQLMQLRNVALFAGTTAVSFVIFAIIYMIVYKLTSTAYYNIVKK